MGKPPRKSARSANTFSALQHLPRISAQSASPYNSKPPPDSLMNHLIPYFRLKQRSIVPQHLHRIRKRIDAHPVERRTAGFVHQCRNRSQRDQYDRTRRARKALLRRRIVHGLCLRILLRKMVGRNERQSRAAHPWYPQSQKIPPTAFRR